MPQNDVPLGKALIRETSKKFIAALEVLQRSTAKLGEFIDKFIIRDSTNQAFMQEQKDGKPLLKQSQTEASLVYHN